MFDSVWRRWARRLAGPFAAPPRGRASLRPRVEALEERALPTGTWAALTNLIPDASGAQTMLLLSDGTVMVQGGSDTSSRRWYRLTPDASGNYANGTWTSLASMNLGRLFYGSAVLPSGKVLVMGGEYTGTNTSNTDSNTGEIYDPVANTWTGVANYPDTHFGDGMLEVLPDGTVLGGDLNSTRTYDYNPATNAWTADATRLHGDPSAEEGWVKLPDGSLLSYAIQGSSPQHGQRFVPGATHAADQWVDAGSVPVRLDSNGGNNGIVPELGPGLLLPDGRVFWVGASGHTALYTPATNTWAAGPDIPGGVGAIDAPAALLDNGKVLLAASTINGRTFSGPTSIVEYDPIANAMTVVSGTGPNLSSGAFLDRMLDLPNGQVLFSNATRQLSVYTPDGTPVTAGQPTVSAITSSGSTFTLTGTQLNGLSEGAAYGDDAQMASNYPLVRLQDGNGNVTFAATSNWSSAGVQTGAAPVTTTFAAPPPGAYLLTVGANGIFSAPALFVALGPGADGQPEPRSEQRQQRPGPAKRHRATGRVPPVVLHVHLRGRRQRHHGQREHGPGPRLRHVGRHRVAGGLDHQPRGQHRRHRRPGTRLDHPDGQRHADGRRLAQVRRQERAEH
jgi:hypothetical protein